MRLEVAGDDWWCFLLVASGGCWWLPVAGAGCCWLVVVDSVSWPSMVVRGAVVVGA